MKELPITLKELQSKKFFDKHDPECLYVFDCQDKLGTLFFHTKDIINYYQPKDRKIFTTFEWYPPTKLKIIGVFESSNLRFRKMPKEYLEVTECIEFEFSEDVKRWPDVVKVGGSFVAHWSKISSLPKKIIFDKSSKNNYTKRMKQQGLYTDRTEITELPRGLDVPDFILVNSLVKEIPDDLRVEGTLDLTETKIIDIPLSVYVGKQISWPEEKALIVDWAASLGLDPDNLTEEDMIMRKLQIGF